MPKLILFLGLACLWLPLAAQDYVQPIFKDTRVINAHSVETLPKRKLDIRIAHRFGDFAGENGGWSTFFGLENASDVLIGAEYGLTDKVTVGAFRTKGAGPLRQYISGDLKISIIRQDEAKSIPLSLTAVGIGSVSTMEASDDPEAINNFDKFSHRISYTVQLLIAHRISDYLSVQLNQGLTHRNIVDFNDSNNLYSLGLAAKVQLTKFIALIGEGTFPFSSLHKTENGYYPALGFGLEVETGGHVFQINVTNATGLIENDFIPYTRSNWTDGEYRLGFTISRLFNL